MWLHVAAMRAKELNPTLAARNRWTQFYGLAWQHQPQLGYGPKSTSWEWGGEPQEPRIPGA